ncbi:MAG: outer membrane protein assembly factor BamE [Acidobacteriota bacterium]|nr:outer membrane protein assembly factor BamE [Acidobacteriota bacterium]
MRVFPSVFASFALLAAACGAGEPPRDHQAEWRDVLRHKPAAVAANASAGHKQLYADSVRAFAEKHPNHSRAQEVWQRLQLEFANDLAGAGRYQDAIRFYRAILANHPENMRARSGLAAAADRLAVTREKLLTLERGMSHRQVAGILGKPIPGWTMKKSRAGKTFEAWYYRTRSGDIAGVYFRDGKVFRAEERSSAPVARLSGS